MVVCRSACVAGVTGWMLLECADAGLSSSGRGLVSWHEISNRQAYSLPAFTPKVPNLFIQGMCTEKFKDTRTNLKLFMNKLKQGVANGHQAIVWTHLFNAISATYTIQAPI